MKLDLSKEQCAKLCVLKGDNEVGAGSPRALMNDPYMNRDVQVLRLMEEYRKYGKLIVAFDFDDTIFDYHKKGYTYPYMIGLLKECQELGFYLVLFTGCAKEKWSGMIEYCKSVGITPCAVNENPFPMPFGNDGKIYYNILLDDRSGLSEACEILKTVINYAKTKRQSCSPS